MSHPHHDTHEIVQRGQEIYERQIRDKVLTEHRGKFLVVDTETGDYEIDKEDVTALKRLRARHPDAVFYILRIGYRAAYSLGGRLQPE